MSDNVLKADRFGISRLSLREATKALEFLGIVEAKPGRGLSVGQTDLERMTGYLEFHPALQDADPVELIGARVVIESHQERLEGESCR